MGLLYLNETLCVKTILRKQNSQFRMTDYCVTRKTDVRLYLLS